jgi:cell wall assembly regulator SMI1
MQIIRRPSETGATEESIQALERELGFPLPVDYRHFLATDNGGEPSPSGFVFETNDGPSDSAVRYFLTLDPGGGSYNIREFRRRYSDRVPQGLMPIACDSFGNLVLIDLRPTSHGTIHFWDHEKESLGDPTWGNVSFVAPSFTAFGQILR